MSYIVVVLSSLQWSRHPRGRSANPYLGRGHSVQMQTIIIVLESCILNLFFVPVDLSASTNDRNGSMEWVVVSLSRPG